jgi:glutathione synthase/RimK-type ligase-like ATP-grasp enzyme
MMKAGIIKYKDRFSAFENKYFEILNDNGIPLTTIDISSPSLISQLSGFSHVLFRWSHYDSDRQMALTLIPVMESLGIKCFPGSATCWHYDDKIRQAYLLEAKGYPFTRSWVFWDRVAALAWLKEAAYPVVFKLKAGAGSTNVVLVRSCEQGAALVRKMFSTGVSSGLIPDEGNVRWIDKGIAGAIRYPLGVIKRKLLGREITPFWQKQKNYALFQRFLPGNEFDTRVTVIGGRAFAFRRFTRKEDFRASGSGLINYDMTAIDKRCIEIALKISREMSFQSMAYDFLFNENGAPEICEISYTYQDRAVHNCPGYWDEQLSWHEGHFWPQYFQLVDLLGVALKPLNE